MALMFWDAEGILFIDYLEKGKTITGEYYSSLLIRPDKKNSWEKTRFAKEKHHLLCFGMLKAFCLLIILKRVKQ